MSWLIDYKAENNAIGNLAAGQGMLLHKMLDLKQFDFL